ncbi:polyprenyl synthetase family protein [Streptomyces sp. NPDC048629]|uniref:polyprenyl synthetase family protein n=1 Tax=Streptomyces sp. NPDC048629 TaxID=3154824 RepID=UPI0034150CC8
MNYAPGRGTDTADLDFGEIRAASDAIIHDLLRNKEESVAQLGLKEHVDEIRPLLLASAGKRMRAVFCLWAWRGAGARGPRADVDIAAAALELNHSAFLIHDDILDRSELRRGQPTTYRRFAARHIERGWQGSSHEFGDGVALTLGDLCFAWAGELISQCTRGERLGPVLEVYHRMYVDALYGQILELQIQADRDFDPSRCLTVAAYKAGRYMLAPPLMIGGALAGADEAVQTAYERFGTALGEAYQLRDDLLGVFGDPAVTGKPNTDDLWEGKPTVLFATALQAAAPSQRDKLLSLYGDRNLDADAADELRDLLQETQAPAAVEEMIRSRAEEAVRALEAAPITSEARTALLALAERALFRTR